MDIAAGIAAATEALGIAKALRAIERNYDEATYKAQVSELICALSDAKLSLSEAREKLADKDKEIEQLVQSFEARADLVKGPGDYKYFVDVSGNPLGFPVCPTCEAKGRIIQLKQDQIIIQAKCPVCSTSFRPVECFLPHSAGGPATLLEQEGLERDAANARASAALRARRGQFV